MRARKAGKDPSPSSARVRHVRGGKPKTGFLASSFLCRQKKRAAESMLSGSNRVEQKTKSDDNPGKL
jgi:hypothetical protein